MLRKITLALLAGVLFGTAGTSVASPAAWWSPAAGSWLCYRADRFPDPAREHGPAWNPAWAAYDRNAKVFAEGLNQVARNAAVGTTLTVPLNVPIGPSYAAICVKY